MAYPVMNDYFHAQWIWNDASGLPEDQYVNNWYFRNDFVPEVPPENGYSDVEGAIFNVLNAFYTGVNGASSSSLLAFLSPNVTSATLKVYDLGVVTPRYPIVEPRAITATGTLSPIPNEVACVMSFKGGNGPNKRGRIYFGPLNESSIDVNGRPSLSLRTTLARGANNVLNSTENVSWAVVSPTTNSQVLVSEGWVDNAFDTQRSRGRRATERLVYDGTTPA